jgi:tetratricopeptide (TPR) repeat protein
MRVREDLQKSGEPTGRRGRWQILLSPKHIAFAGAAIALSGGAAVFEAPLRAQTVAGLSGEDSLFQVMLRNPSNFDAILKYANSAKQQGDVEASIGALEQLLFYNPELPQVRLELATLYFRLGSYEMSRGYFEIVQSSARVTPEMKRLAQDYLDAIDAKLQSDQWSGYFQSGFRYQTNASLGPNQQSLIGATRPIDSRFAARPDWNWFAAFALNYVHDFGNDHGDIFEANIEGYDAQQFMASQVDVGLLDIRFGPRFDLFSEELSGASFKPYVAVAGAILAGAPYLGTFGGGISVRFNLANIALNSYVEVRGLDYRNSSLYPLASGLDGTLATFALQAAGQFVEGCGWEARFALNHSDSSFSWFSYNRYAFDFWFPCTFPSPWGGRGWTVAPSIGVAPWIYRQPDPVNFPLITEHALEWRAGIGLNIPMEARIGFGILLQYHAIDSNVPANTIKDFAVTLGPTINF